MRFLGAVEAGVAAAQAAHLHHHLGGRLGHEDDVAAVGGAVGETPARALAERAAECPVCRIRGGQQSAFQLASNAVSSSARVDGKCRGGETPDDRNGGWESSARGSMGQISGSGKILNAHQQRFFPQKINFLSSLFSRLEFNKPISR